MDQKFDHLRRQLDMQAATLAQLERLIRQQSDTASRRCDATFKTLHEGFRGINCRLDQHETIFEALDGRLDESGAALALAR